MLLLAQWFSSSAASSLAVSKLWLFNNSLGDSGVAALAPLLGPATTELHLSHNSIGTAGARALLAAVPVARARGVKPLWLRLEWNLIDAAELRRFIEQECAGRGLVVDVAEEVPVEQRSRTDANGRELNLKWSRHWTQVHVQIPWLACQRSIPAEAAVLQTARAAWQRSAGSSSSSSSSTAAPAPAAAAAASQQRQQQVLSSGGSRRGGGAVVAAMASDGGGQLPLVHPPPPPPPKAAAAAAAATTQPPPPPPRSTQLQQPPPPPPAAAPAGVSSSPSSATPVAVPGSRPQAASQGQASYRDGPLLLFVDTSALLSMLGASGSVSSATCCTLKLLQALASSGRFGRQLSAEQQTFIVLADTVLKQLDGLKGNEGVGGPVRRFLDRGLDELGPAGADFLTVLAANEGEGLVLDRQAAVAGSVACGPTGQKSDLSIIEVGLFFRSELLAAAAGADGGADDAAEAQPVLLLTNDNGQLQLAKAHGLPAFKLAGAAAFESSLGEIVRSGAELSSAVLRQLMMPAATAGLGALAQRSLQEEFDGAVACLASLLEAYEDLSSILARICMSAAAAGDGPGEAAAALSALQQLLQDHQHVMPFGAEPVAGGSVSVLEASQENMTALEGALRGWQALTSRRQTPSRVLKWASSRR